MSPSRTTTQWYPKQACQIIAENTQTWRLHAPTRKRIKASLCIFNNGFCSIHIELFLHPWIITTRLVWLTVQSMSGFGFTNEKNTTSILIILLLCFLRMLIDWCWNVDRILFPVCYWSEVIFLAETKNIDWEQYIFCIDGQMDEWTRNLGCYNTQCTRQEQGRSSSAIQKISIFCSAQGAVVSVAWKPTICTGHF